MNLPLRTLVPVSVVVVALLAATPARAQLAGANAAGVRLGHVHLVVSDVDAQTRFWTDAMGGHAVQNGPLTLIELPGVYVMLRKGEATAPPAGSVVNHFGFVFRNLPAMIERWKAAGLTIEQNANPNQGYVHAPDGVRVEFFGDPSLPVPMQVDHVHAYVPTKDIPAIQAWYAKVFGAEPGQRVRVATPGWIDAVFLPGLNWSFSTTDMPLAPTKGRSLDHMGFDVLDLDAFITHLTSLGLPLDAPPRAIQGAKTRVAFMTDPWGTYLEITEHLAP